MASCVDIFIHTGRVSAICLPFWGPNEWGRTCGKDFLIALNFPVFLCQPHPDYKIRAFDSSGHGRLGVGCRPGCCRVKELSRSKETFAQEQVECL